MPRKFQTIEEVESKYCSEILYQNKIYYIVGCKVEGNSIAIYITSYDNNKREKEIKVMGEELFENAIFVKNNQHVGVEV